MARESGSPCKNHKNMIVLMIRGFSDSGDSGLWILPVGMSRFQGGSRLHARLRVLKAVASCGDGNPPPRQRVRSKRGFSSEIQDFAVFGCLSSLDPSICSPHEDGAFRTRILKALSCNLAPPLYAGHSVHFLSVARESGSPCKNHKNMIVRFLL